MKNFLSKHKILLPPIIAFLLFGTVGFVFQRLHIQLAFPWQPITDMSVRLLAFGAAIWLLLSIRTLVKTSKPAVGRLLLILSICTSALLTLFTAFDLYLLFKWLP